jgi:protein-S-isoprenylcysteine O-methyltransferase Ste14
MSAAKLAADGVIKREEWYLERRFGQEYLEFKKRRRRWI